MPAWPVFRSHGRLSSWVKIMLEFQGFCVARRSIQEQAFQTLFSFFFSSLLDLDVMKVKEGQNLWAFMINSVGNLGSDLE